MKLRIKGSSLRLRLTQGEIRELAEGRAVEEKVPFAAQTTLTYRLKRDSEAREITAAYAGNIIEIRVPERAALQWCASEQVSLTHSQPVPGGDLRIALEKDFACLAPRADEDESDNFPHPQTGRLKC
ncbi:MAG: hypothetical protein JWN85_3995 [Gammaproteobacteria bacterium]|nr:hypothetical protein [Gammaproteobacteria bacterium]